MIDRNQIQKGALSRHEEPHPEDIQPLLQELFDEQASMKEIESEAETVASASFWSHVPIINGLVGVYGKYDSTFLTVLGMQYFNQGTKVLIFLASSDLFKAYFGMEPGRVQAI